MGGRLTRPYLPAQLRSRENTRRSKNPSTVRMCRSGQPIQFLTPRQKTLLQMPQSVLSPAPWLQTRSFPNAASWPNLDWPVKIEWNLEDSCKVRAPTSSRPKIATGAIRTTSAVPRPSPIQALSSRLKTGQRVNFSTVRGLVRSQCSITTRVRRRISSIADGVPSPLRASSAEAGTCPVLQAIRLF